ncbi:MAG: septum formation family protein [Acidimicrobiales bacterium]
MGSLGPKWRSFTKLAAGVAVLVALAGCGSDRGEPPRDSTGQVLAPTTVDALDIHLADCFNNPGVESVEEVMVVPCAEPHDFEVFHSFQLADGPYPGDDKVQDEWFKGCLAEFEAFVGTKFDESALDVSAIYPTEQTWNELEDREVLCSVTAIDGTRRTGSARNAGI